MIKRCSSMFAVRRSWHLLIRSASASTAATAEGHDSDEVQPYSAIPKKPHVPVLSSLWDLYCVFRGTSQDQLIQEAKAHGGMYRRQEGPQEVLFVSDPDAVEEIYRQDDSSTTTPKLRTITPFQYWKNENNKPHGVLTTNTDDWRRMRTALNKQIARPATVAQHTSTLGHVATLFVQRIHEIQQANPDGGVVLPDELFKWVFESLGHILFEQKLGCISAEVDEEIRTFAKAADDAFMSMIRIIILPQHVAKKYMPYYYNLHDQCWNSMFNIGSKLLDNRLQELEAKASRGEEVGGFLASLMTNPNMSREEIYSNVIDLMMAALKTTTVAMQWILYAITEYRESAALLEEEVLSVVGTRDTPTTQHLQEMKYLKAFIKEVLRVHPPVVLTTKISSADMVVRGYNIPADTIINTTMYVMGKQPSLFSEPSLFKPERWLGESRQQIHSFAYMPFSYGTRNCIGRRFAELQLQLLTTTLLQNFTMTLVGPKRREKFIGILEPFPPVEIKFSPRRV